MLPFYKLFSLVVRVFARPLINYTRKYHISNQSSESSYIKTFFIRFGNVYHRIEMNINRRFLKMTSNYTSKPLNNELALEKGIEIFYEIMIYAILIGFSVFEMVVSTKEANQKKKLLDARLDSYKVSLAVMEENVRKVSHNFQAIVDKQKGRIQELEEQLKTKEVAQPKGSFFSHYTNKPNQPVQQLEQSNKSDYLHAFETLGRRFSVKTATRGAFDHNQLLYPF